MRGLDELPPLAAALSAISTTFSVGAGRRPDVRRAATGTDGFLSFARLFPLAVAVPPRRSTRFRYPPRELPPPRQSYLVLPPPPLRQQQQEQQVQQQSPVRRVLQVRGQLSGRSMSGRSSMSGCSSMSGRSSSSR